MSYADIERFFCDAGALMDAAGATEARGLEVRLLRRLPAQPARPRGRAADARRADRDRLLPRGLAGDASRAPTTSRSSRARSRPPADAERIQEVRRVSRRLVTIGACATAGGIQALRNFADVDEFVAAVYATPAYISTLETSTPIAAHVPVDFELHGCPIDKHQLLEVIARLPRRAPPGDPRVQRLRGVQAARQRLRDGRPRDALPRPGHARRLRRDLPGPRPRLLRLLRADGDAEHGVAVGLDARPRRRDSGPGPRLPQLQRQRARLPGGRRCDAPRRQGR